MKIGLLGGSFDPPHNAHVAVAQVVLNARGLDRVDLLVSGQSPHKSGKQNHAGLEHRLAMARIAVEGIEGVGVEDIETRREGRSYTVDTVRLLKEERPGTEYSFIIGGDMLKDLPNWRKIHELLKLIQFIPVFRPGHTEEVFKELAGIFEAKTIQGLQANAVEMPLMDISSTAIRTGVAAGESIEALVPPGVAAYIYAQHLYV